MAKTQLEDLLESRNPQKKANDLIIGRMEHICQKQAI